MTMRTLAPALLLLLLFGVGALAMPADAQEIRASLSQGHSGIRAVGFPRGFGAGVRVFSPWGVGVAVEVDRLGSTPRIRQVTCAAAGDVDCVEERVALETEMDIATFIVMLGGQGDVWAARLGIGRSAGVITSTGIGQDTGREVTVPPADDGAGSLDWSRGSDGSVLVIEVLRRLPVPGPFPVSAQAAYRRHHTDMTGCAPGEFSPFCGQRGFNELQLGIALGLWPSSGGG